MIYARRYHWADMDPVDNTDLLDAFVANPALLPYPCTPDVARQAGAGVLTDPRNIVWASYCDKNLTGVILLERVIPNVDALFRFLVLDRDLAGKRKLLHNLIGTCFSEFGFNRLSMEVPEGSRLERFARRVLGFKYEGEGRTSTVNVPAGFKYEAKNQPQNIKVPVEATRKWLEKNDDWVAKQGSRSERAHFTGTEWVDLIRLRLLASEWEGTA